LKAIVAMSGVGDYFLNYATPQGSMYAAGAGAVPFNLAANSAHPPIYRSLEQEPAAAARWIDVAPERICDDVLEQLVASVRDPLVDDRSEPFYDERRLTDRFSNVRAAALITAGFFDIQALNQSIDAIGWRLLAHAPKAMVMGQWGHAAPTFPQWTDRVVDWFDFWLKGLGDPPTSLGTVEYEAGGRAPCENWPCSTASSWPPSTVKETLYAAGHGLSGESVMADAASFVAGIRPAADLTSCATDPLAATFTTQALTSPATIAGSQSCTSGSEAISPEV
jgi:predicted acyl esterase